MGGILPPEIVGLDKSAEVVTAKYAGGGVLTLLLYPTPQIAGDRGRAIEAEINANRLRRGGEAAARRAAAGAGDGWVLGGAGEVS